MLFRFGRGRSRRGEGRGAMQLGVRMDRRVGWGRAVMLRFCLSGERRVVEILLKRVGVGSILRRSLRGGEVGISMMGVEGGSRGLRYVQV